MAALVRPRHKRRILKLFREATSKIRIMPDFIIIGAMNCGTTSLYRDLIEHPCITPAFKKEIFFFSHNFKRGVDWYRSHFTSSLFKLYAKHICKQNILTGEASPYYIFHPQVPRRISQTIPEVKLIALLRNPIDRAYSQYNMRRIKGHETLSFEEAIEKEEERLKGEKEKMLKDENYSSYSYQMYSYLSRGIYVDQLKAWMNFFPREQFLILKSEDFFSDPPSIYRQVLKFLDLSIWEPKHYGKYNAHDYQTMNSATRKRLISYYEPYNQELYQYLGMNFGWDRLSISI
jgi:hypothetical protein